MKEIYQKTGEKKWWQRFEFYLTATGISEKDNKIKTSTFLHVIGQEALDIYNTFKFETAGDELKLDKVQEKFKNYCNPRKNLTYERHVFFTRNQNRNETIDQYVTDLRNKASTCDFGDLCDSLIKDRLICGVADEAFRERLLRDADLTLAKAIDICRASEVSKSQIKSLTEDDKSAHVQVVKQKHSDTQRRQSMRKSNDKIAATRRQQSAQSDQCTRCGLKHISSQCPAQGKTCKVCKLKNHFARMCFSRKNSQGKYHKRQINTLHEPEISSDSECETTPLFIGIVGKPKKSDWYADMRINNQEVQLKLDTGAQCNVLLYTSSKRSEESKL